MNKSLLIIVLVCLGGVLHAQNKQVTIGLHGSAYTPVEPLEKYINPQAGIAGGNFRLNTKIYGASAQWFPIWINRKTNRNAVYAEYYRVDHEFIWKEGGEVDPTFNGGVKYIHNDQQHTYKNYYYSVGVRHVEPIGRCNLYIGAGYIYFHYKRTSSGQYQYLYDENNNYLGYKAIISNFPGSSASGLNVNAGLDVFVSPRRNVSLGFSIASSWLRTRINDTYSGSTITSYWSVDHWEKYYVEGGYGINNKQEYVTSIVPSINVKYYFNIVKRWPCQ